MFSEELGLIPLHGYFDGDFLLLETLALADQTVAELAEQFAEYVIDLRLERTGSPLRVVHQGRELDPTMTVRQAGLTPFERVDILQS